RDVAGDAEPPCRVPRARKHTGRSRGLVDREPLRADLRPPGREDGETAERTHGLADRRQREDTGGGRDRAEKPAARQAVSRRLGTIRAAARERDSRSGRLRPDVHDERADRDPCRPEMAGREREAPRPPEAGVGEAREEQEYGAPHQGKKADALDEVRE